MFQILGWVLKEDECWLDLDNSVQDDIHYIILIFILAMLFKYKEKNVLQPQS